MKVALVCDSMSAFGGAERVIEQVLRLYPKADMFSVLDVVPENQRAFLSGRRIESSFLQSLPSVSKYYRKLLHFWPLAVEQLDVIDYDLVISSHHSVAYGVLTRPGQVHVSYVHSPMRYAWDLQHQYLREARLNRGLMSVIARRTLHKARIWDYAAAQRPDAMVANSHFVAERLWKTHRRRANVIHPPVAVERMRCSARKGDYYLSVGRLVPYKRVDLLARAFALMPHRRLKIVGAGPDMKKVAALRAPNVEILGFQPDQEVRELLAGAKAFVFAGVEDFGIAAVEAQASGTPIIAYRSGGMTEIVIDSGEPNPTGLFFDGQCEGAIVAAVEAFERSAGLFSAEACAANAMRFTEERFRMEFAAFVEDALAAQRDGRRALPPWLAPRHAATPPPVPIDAD